MRKALPLSFFSLLLFFYCGSLLAQNDRFAYAITDAKPDGAGWNMLRKIDLRTGEYSDVLLNGAQSKTTIYDASTKKEWVQPPNARYGNALIAPFSTGVAAAAYDRKHQRLYFTPMFVDQLRYIDLRTMKLYYVTDAGFTGAGDMHNNEAKCITRMVIAPDGYGYALSNDGKTFVRFSTDKKPSIKQLGSLVDDPSNNGISIYNSCSSYGGDMIADDKGNLYILTARNHAFVVNIETKAAKHLGSIKGLPQGFTVNGAVVDGAGNLLVSSALSSKAYYVVNPKSWEASVFSAPVLYRSSDLANSNYLATTRRNNSIIETIAARSSAFSNLIQVYPNPVTQNVFTLQFNQVPAGEYKMELTDVMGRLVVQKEINVGNENTTQAVPVNAANAKGVYLIRISNLAKKSVFEQKILIQ